MWRIKGEPNIVSKQQMKIIMAPKLSEYSLMHSFTQNEYLIKLTKLIETNKIIESKQ